MTDSYIFLPPSATRFRPARMPVDGRYVHLPLTYDLAVALRPKMFVALGVDRGAVYYSACQGIADSGADALAYAVGTWPEVPDSPPGDERFDDFCAHGREFHAGFSYTLRLPFEQARAHFADTSIDLLYLGQACLAEEIPRWFPKLRPGGVLVVRDAGAPDSEVRLALNALQGKQCVFDSTPAPGLIYKPLEANFGDVEPLLRILFDGDTKQQHTLQAIYTRIVRHLELDYEVGSVLFGHARGKRHHLK